MIQFHFSWPLGFLLASPPTALAHERDKWLYCYLVLCHIFPCWANKIREKEDIDYVYPFLPLFLTSILVVALMRRYSSSVHFRKKYIATNKTYNSVVGPITLREVRSFLVLFHCKVSEVEAKKAAGHSIRGEASQNNAKLGVP